MNNEEVSRKISFPAKVIMMILVLSADILDLLIPTAVTGVGIIVVILSWIYGFIISWILTFWLFMIGANIKWAVPGFLIELIPGLNLLPARTAALLITFAKDEAETIIKVAPIANKLGVAKKAAKLINKV